MMQHNVTVVIPTSGRHEVGSAVRSALDQVGIDVEVIVVDNSPGASSRALGSLPEAVRVLRSSDKAKANGARQLGIQQATHPLIALLDDDDEWHPTKLSRQLGLCSDLGLSIHDRWVVSCGIQIMRENGERLRAPKEFPAGPVSPERYLFRRDTLTDQHRQLQTSTLVFPRMVALETPFDASQRFHQDWTWLLAAARRGAEVYQAPEYLVTYLHNSTGSITSASKCSESIDWAHTHLSASKRIRGDFILTVPFNMATMAGDTRWQRRAFFEAFRTSRPGPYSIARTLAILIKSSLRQRA